MAPAFSSPGGVVGTQGAKPASSAAFASSATHHGENFMLSGSKMATNKQMLKVAVPFTADDKVNPTPVLTMLLKTCKFLDANSRLKSNDPLFSPIVLHKNCHIFYKILHKIHIFQIAFHCRMPQSPKFC
jgi:hypothetical protein